MPTDDTLGHPAPDLALGRVQGEASATAVPAYLQDAYWWAYLSPVGRAFFDRPLIVSAILWGNYHRLIDAACAEIAPGSHVLQTACVYGEFSPRLAARIGDQGSLDVIDVAQIQVDHCRLKLEPYRHARVFIGDAANPPPGPYDTVCSFFLLHEVPEDYKHRIVDAVLARVPVGGRVVFVDYHEPSRWHPLRPVMKLVFHWLEPYARALWGREISSFAAEADRFRWSKETYFGGLYQRVVAIRTAA